MADMSSSGRRKLIIDVDTGIDDAHAIMLSLSSPSVEVLAITCVNGNVKINEVTANTLRVLQVCNRLDVPVYKGAAQSMLGRVLEYEDISAVEAWKVPVDMAHLQAEHAANAMIRLVNQFPGEITLVALAPLTNVALAIGLDSELPKKLKDIVIMGGNTDARGRVSPCAEFNFFTDPEAAHVVLATMDNIRLLPYEVCCRHNMPWDFIEQWTSRNTPKSSFVRDLLEFDFQTGDAAQRNLGYKTCDGYAMAAAVDSSVVTEIEQACASVELCGQMTRGQLVVDWNGLWKKRNNVSLILGLDLPKIQGMFLSMVQ